MRLHLVLAATLAASFIVGCSRQKSTSPPPKALASAGPIAKPVRLSHETTGAPPPKADPPPAMATASLPAQNQDPPEATPPPAPPNPYDDLEDEWVPIYKDFEKLLEPTVDRAVAAARALKQLTQGDTTGLPEDIQIRIALVKLGRYPVCSKREAEKRLRSFLVDAKGKEPEARRYIAVVDSLLAGQEMARLLAAAYERALDAGADIPVDAQKKLADLLRSDQEPRVRQDDMGTLTAVMENLRRKLLEQSARADDVFHLAVIVHGLGESVIKKRELCRTFHDLVMALPEPERSDVLIRLAWSPDQEAELDRERKKLKVVELSRPSPKKYGMAREDRPRYEAEYARDLASIATDRRQKFIELEQARRNTIEGCFRNLDAPGWESLKTLDSLFAELQAVLDEIVPGFSFRLCRLIAADAPQEDALNVLTRIPLPGSVEDRVPTIRVDDDFEVMFDAPEGQLSYANLLKPGNVLVGTLWMEECNVRGERLETTYHAELHITAVEKKAVQGELVVEGNAGRQVRIPFQGAISPTGFSFVVRGVIQGEQVDLGTFTGSLDKGGPLTGQIAGNDMATGSFSGSFSFSLKK